MRKGRGGCSSILACEGAGAMLTEPTSLNRGEGLVTGTPGEVGGGEGASEGGGRVVEWWWWTNESEIQPLMELMLN